MIIRWLGSLLGLCCNHRWSNYGTANDGGPIRRQCIWCNRLQWRLPPSQPFKSDQAQQRVPPWPDISPTWKNTPWCCVMPMNWDPKVYRAHLRDLIRSTLDHVYPGHFKTFFFQ